MLKKLRFGTMLMFSLLLSLSLCYSAFASAVGQQLTSPEQGWKRYDDASLGITYSSGWRLESASNHYNGTHHYPTGGISSSVKFKFKGTSLRLGSYSHAETRISEVKIKIDGTVETYNPKFGNSSPQMIVYEKTGLIDTEHSVEIWNDELGSPTVGYGLDFIDINDSGYLVVIADSPSALVATGQDKNVQLVWSGISDATGYNIQRSLTSGGPYSTIATNVTGTTCADINVTNGTTYYYVVTAVNASGESANSNEASATPQGPIVQPETGRAILTITLDTGLEKEFDLSMAEVNSFISWYEGKAAGSGTASYAIDKHDNNKGPFKNRKDYVIFDKILTFEVNEYEVTE